MNEYDILANVIFLSKENGGRKELPPIQNSEYTYRPIFRLDGDSIGHCCGIVIGNYIKNYSFETELDSIKILFLDFQKVKDKIVVGSRFKLLEGNTVVATGKILEIKPLFHAEEKV